jgi:hypothetical protein
VAPRGLEHHAIAIDETDGAVREAVAGGVYRLA